MRQLTEVCMLYELKLNSLQGILMFFSQKKKIKKNYMPAVVFLVKYLLCAFGCVEAGSSGLN